MVVSLAIICPAERLRGLKFSKKLGAPLIFVVVTLALKFFEVWFMSSQFDFLVTPSSLGRLEW